VVRGFGGDDDWHPASGIQKRWGKGTLHCPGQRELDWLYRLAGAAGLKPVGEVGFSDGESFVCIFLAHRDFCGRVSLMAWYGLVNDRVLWQDHILYLLLLYPLWGLLQQFLVQALGVANLMTVFPKPGWMVAIPVGIVLFAIIHFPHGLLMIVAGVMAGLFIPCYLRDRSLWPLGLYHGWLGTFFYLWVLGKDPWVSVFGK
jgi:hypothetical protein